MPDDIDDVPTVDEGEPVEPPEPVEDEAKPAVPKPTVPAQGGSKRTPTAEESVLAKDLRMAIADRTRAKKERDDLRTELDALRLASASDAERAVLTAKQEAATEAAAARDAVLRPAVVKANARAALASAGCKEPAVQKTMLRLIDPVVVEIDDDGEVSGGLAEQIALLQEQFPEKFAPEKVTVPSAREVNAGNKKPPEVPKSASDRLAARLTGK